MPLALSPQESWQPLPASEWNTEAARHLLWRAGWTARPEAVERAVAEGLPATLDRLFPAEPALLAKPRLVARVEKDGPLFGPEAQKMSVDERARSLRESSERQRLALQDLAIQWLQYAARPETAAVAKWVLFLSDVFVIAADKVRQAGHVHAHYDILGRHGFGPAPALAKAISRSPAMVTYLDLNQSQRRKPNENFARELFELFVLGEGNYSENDIKEAARAFTGYRSSPLQSGGFTYSEAQHDDGEKTVFGVTGKLSGDDVIDLAYRQPAAGRFLPQELVKFYLSDTPLPADHLAALGARWSAGGFSLRELARTFFGSRVFFAPEFRGGFIKSPIQFYLGLVQDLRLEVTPLQRYTLIPMRQMGQQLFYPPNVRGWVGGRNWINSATLGARRTLVDLLFMPIDERSLNADEQLDLVAARSNGVTAFTVDDTTLAPLAKLEDGEVAERLIADFLAVPTGAEFAARLRKFLAAGPDGEIPRLNRVRRAAITLLQSAEYQLC